MPVFNTNIVHHLPKTNSLSLLSPPILLLTIILHKPNSKYDREGGWHPEHWFGTVLTVADFFLLCADRLNSWIKSHTCISMTIPAAVRCFLLWIFTYFGDLQQVCYAITTSHGRLKVGWWFKMTVVLRAFWRQTLPEWILLRSVASTEII